MSKRLLFIIIGIFSLSACNISDECESGKRLGLNIILNLVNIIEPIDDIHVYIFDASNRLNVYRSFTSKAAMEADRFYVDNGDHTVVVVINVGSDFFHPTSKHTRAEEFPDVMLNDFVVWLKDVSPQYPDMLTGMAEGVVYEGGNMTIRLKINRGTSNINFSILRLTITIPDGKMPDYESRVSSFNIRIVAEVYKKGTVLRVHRYSEILRDNTLDLYLQAGDYDILLWADYTPSGSLSDYHYVTSSLREITFNEAHDYVSGAESRNAFGLRFDVKVLDQPITEKHVILEALLAKYRIVATDVERYKERITTENYPPLEDLITTVSYQGFFPNSYDLRTGSPNNSGREITFISPLRDITDSTATLISDYLFTNYTDSYIYATVKVLNENGDILTSIPSVKINYRRGYITTVESDFLTAGIVAEGIKIDTEWEGVFDVEF